MMLVVTFKYVAIIMRADNKGEGGSLALLALINRKSEGRKWSKGIILLGVFATALFYGDSMITPAIFGAVGGRGPDHGRGGLRPAGDAGGGGHPDRPVHDPVSRGTAKVGRLFGPIMLIYFTVLGVLGVWHILGNPHVLIALNPYYAFRSSWRRAISPSWRWARWCWR